MDWKRSDKHSIVQVIVLHRFGCLIEKTTNVLSAEILRRLSYGGADYVTGTQVNNESFFPRARVKTPPRLITAKLRTIDAEMDRSESVFLGLKAGR